jgi:ferric-dicitrate binding protein FerR (iron transport regulator)
MLKFLYWFKHPHKTEDPIDKVEDALESSARRLQAIDPETDGQWRHLKSTLESKQSMIYDHHIAVQRGLFRPAISFSITFAVLIVIGVIWLHYSSDRIYETAKGQHSNITLQDSTEVILNYMSELRVNRWSIEKTRHVTLKGEALFHVHKNGTPFVLTTDIGTVQVLGTQFNVRVRDNKMEVAVLSGIVKVSMNKNGIDSSITLIKDQIAVCEKNDFPGIPGTIPFTEYPGWTHGKFMFYRTNLLSACKEMESQFDVIIRLEKPQQQNVTITGIVNGQNVEGALTTLTQLTGNKYRYEDGSYIIY